MKPRRSFQQRLQERGRRPYDVQEELGPEHPPLASKITGIKLAQGDRVKLETPGGGGYGDPAERRICCCILYTVVVDRSTGLIMSQRGRQSEKRNPGQVRHVRLASLAQRKKSQ